MKDVIHKAAKIKLLIFDVDGVLTDGKIYLTDSNNEYKAFYTRDGVGIKLLLKSGVEVGIITGRNSPMVSQRMQQLGVKHILQGQNDKLKAFEDLVNQLELDYEETAFMGDDVLDLPAMRRSGLSIAVADAAPIVLKNSDWITTAKGGRGAAREASGYCGGLLQRGKG